MLREKDIWTAVVLLAKNLGSHPASSSSRPVAERVEDGSGKKKRVSLAPPFANGTVGAVKKKASVSTTPVFNVYIHTYT